MRFVNIVIEVKTNYDLGFSVNQEHYMYYMFYYLLLIAKTTIQDSDNGLGSSTYHVTLI